jgi:hypothetical protein
VELKNPQIALAIYALEDSINVAFIAMYVEYHLTLKQD